MVIDMSKLDPSLHEILEHLQKKQKEYEEELKTEFNNTSSDERERVAMYLLDYCNSTGSPYDAELINDNSADPVMAVYYQLNNNHCYCDPYHKPVWDPSSDSYEIIEDNDDNFIHLSPFGLGCLKRGYVWDPNPSLKRLEIHLAQEANKIAESALEEAKKANATALEAKQTVALLTSKVDELSGKESERNQLIQKTNEIVDEGNEIAAQEVETSKEGNTISREANSLSSKAGNRSRIALFVQIGQALIALAALFLSIISICMTCS